MHGPPVVTGLLAAVCAGTGTYCLTVSVRAREPVRAEAVMGPAMAAMVLPGSAGPVPSAAFVVLFGGLALWSGRAACALPGARRAPPGQRGHSVHHTVEAAAMAYMAAAMLATAPATAAHAAHHEGAPAGVPLVTGGLLVYFAAYALRTGARLATAGAGGPGPPGAGTPEVTAACRLALSLASFTMLLTL